MIWTLRQRTSPAPAADALAPEVRASILKAYREFSSANDGYHAAQRLLVEATPDMIERVICLANEAAVRLDNAIIALRFTCYGIPSEAIQQIKAQDEKEKMRVRGR